MAGTTNITMQNVTGGIITVGDGNSTVQSASPEVTLAMARESFATIRAALDKLPSPEHGKITRALEDAGEEIAKNKPDKREHGEALQRALTKAKDAGQIISELEKPVNTIAGWIGSAAPAITAGLRALFG